MAVPWDRPYIPKLAVGSITDDEIYLSVGKAISAWESVEASYASIFAGFTSQHGIDHQPAVRAFGVVTTVMTRRHMIEAAADAFFRQYDEISDLRPSMEDHQAELKGLLQLYQGWSSRRNDVAHGFVTKAVFVRDEDAWIEPDKSMFLLVPSLGASRKRMIEWYPDYQYRADHIDVFTYAFHELADQANRFCEALQAWKSSVQGRTPCVLFNRLVMVL